MPKHKESDSYCEWTAEKMSTNEMKSLLEIIQEKKKAVEFAEA